MKRIVSLILVAVMTIAFLAACSEPGNESSAAESKTESAPDVSAVEQSSEEVSVDDCPLEEKRWDESLILLMPDSKDVFAGEFWQDEATDEGLSVVFVERSRALKDKYGISIELRYASHDSSVPTELETAISGGLKYNIACASAFYMAPKTADGYFYDFYEINNEANGGKGYINFEADYWDQGLIKDMSIANKLFFLTGDICVTDDNATWVMLFNKDMIKQYNFEDPYEIVNKNEWTMDKMTEMAKQVTLKHGDKMSFKPEDGDIWGIVGRAYDGIMFMLGYGCAKVQKNSDDIPELSITNQRNVECFDKLFTMFKDSSYCGIADFYGAWDSGVYDDAVRIFANGNSLFMPSKIDNLFNEIMTSSDIDYGIIPMPKVNDTQDAYCASGNVYDVMFVSVPICCPADELDMTLFTIEALAYYGKKMITPSYYNLVLKGQKTKDEESEKNIDLIFKSRKYDLSDAYNFNNIIQFYNNVISGGSTNTYVSKSESYFGGYNKALNDFVDTLIGTEEE